MILSAMSTLEKRLGKRLRALRGEASLRDFARKLGVDAGSLNRMEHAKQNVTIKTLGKFCVRLKCDIGDLFSDPPAEREDD